ncbi:YihY/virulence factor BrkB family protein [Jannaschia sp. Os4]|uniref:YihY/virulence factor BrkB family protein n=1 Tax=Jannaschia sp. Os4 TaxID=2807617 RepID=UPI00193A78E8|nr:YihY/virulence factor BrkB family protein [Jannaschia sp. Os4]MBM2577810.1 YihY/virulence factor BrkB family protein [Jannaschia sp. Os4]
MASTTEDIRSAASPEEAARLQPGRGRDATKPTEIPAKGWSDVLKRTFAEISNDNVMLVAAGVAFYGLLAVFPAITALMSITGLLYSPDELVSVLEGVTAVVPPDVSEILLDQARAVASSAEGGLTLGLIVGVALALWSASAGVDALVTGINVAYDEEETRGFVRRKGMILLMTVGMIVGVILAAALVVVVPIVLAVVSWAPGMETAISVLKYVPLALIVLVGLGILYRYSPDRDAAKWRWLTTGTLIAGALWLVASIAFSIYVQTFGSYNETFGSIAGVVVLLMWMWISALVILVGAELNSELEHQTARDTTTGVREPMGHRGAVKADTLGAAK